jgi:hypothetical protein
MSPAENDGISERILNPIKRFFGHQQQRQRLHRSRAALWNREQLSRCQDCGDDCDHGLLAVRVQNAKYHFRALSSLWMKQQNKPAEQN